MTANKTTNRSAEAPDQAALEQFRGYLLRYALLQLRDQGAAEDVVQETLLAAIEGGGRFSGKSSVKTWLTGILKHKIIDHVRRQSREQPLMAESDDPERSETEAVDALFAADGHWRNFPANWGDPDRSFENKKFWEVFEMCAKLMPAKTARVFTMREVLELSTEEICKELGITATNCWVMLHRARLSLRECLELKWFGQS
ncbi:MAG: sigma-70 family RNA polymerase sigma factor [Betaproteobacteria bacterium]|nr:sigma-70 family RNA polymerase sigma factor [Betaproteobacteria bacterium]